MPMLILPSTDSGIIPRKGTESYLLYNTIVGIALAVYSIGRRLVGKVADKSLPIS